MNEDDVRGFYEAMGSGDVRRLEDVLAEDVVMEFPGERFGGRFEGRRKVVVFLRQNQRLFDGGLRFRVAWAGSCGDRAIAQWTNAGRTRDGQDYANRGVTVFTLRDGRIARIEDYLDTARLDETWPR